jgi:thioredoxin 1
MAMDRQGHVSHLLFSHRYFALALLVFTTFANGCASGGRGVFPNFFAAKDEAAIEDTNLADSSNVDGTVYPLGEVGKESDSAGKGTNSSTKNQSRSDVLAQETNTNRYTEVPGQNVATKTPSTPAKVVSYPGTAPSSKSSTDSVSKEPALIVLQDSREFMPLLASSSGPVLLDFYTTWCGPCRKQSQILHEMEGVAAQNGARIIKVDAEKHREIAKRFQVKVYPTLVLLKDGAVQAHNPGAIFDKQELTNWLTP